MDETTEDGIDLLMTIIILSVVASIGFYFSLNTFNTARQNVDSGLYDKSATTAVGYVNNTYSDAIDYKDVLLMTQLQDETLPQHKGYSIGSANYLVDYDYKFNLDTYWRSAYTQLRSLGDVSTDKYRFIYSSAVDKYVLVKGVE